MGPGPCARSNHFMTAVGPKVFLLGGSNDGSLGLSRSNDLSTVHILDTGEYSLGVCFIPADHPF